MWVMLTLYLFSFLTLLGKDCRAQWPGNNFHSAAIRRLIQQDFSNKYPLTSASHSIIIYIWIQAILARYLALIIWTCGVIGYPKYATPSRWYPCWICVLCTCIAKIVMKITQVNQLHIFLVVLLILCRQCAVSITTARFSWAPCRKSRSWTVRRHFFILRNSFHVSTPRCFIRLSQQSWPRSKCIREARGRVATG